MSFELIMSCWQDQIGCSAGFIGIGLIILILGVRLYLKCIACRFWPMTDGKILSNKEFPDIYNPKHAENTKVEKVYYSYSLHKVEYKSHRVSFEYMLPTRQTKLELAIKYRFGMRVAVQYNPNKPKESILENQDMTKPLLIILTAFMFLTLGLILLANCLLTG